MDTAPDPGNLHETLTAIERKIAKDFGWAVVFGIACCVSLLLALSAWHAILMANATPLWATVSLVTGVAAFSQYVKVARGVARAIKLYWTEFKKAHEGHPHTA